MNRVINAFRGSQLTARILRSVSWVVVGHAGTQALRLASNLILTRILFPEAFGLMALVTMVTVGLMMFSDVGIGPAVTRSPRGDEPAFLNTAWTIKVIRGCALWIVTMLLAWPFARFYGHPELALYLPVAGLSLVAQGFLPTRVTTARRHLLLGRVTMLDLASQVLGLGLMVILALWTRSVLALVVGSVLSQVIKLWLMWAFLPGHRDRFQIERPALRELIGFGKWIFLSTALVFVGTQGDKAVMGKLLTLETLGIYNIGFFLASFPLMMGQSVAQDVLVSVYRDRPPHASAENRRKLRRMRFLITGGLGLLLLLMAYIGPPLVAFLYDQRYHAAGAMMVLMACGFLPQAIGLTYDKAALAAGDSRGFFLYTGVRSALQMGLLVIGLVNYGLIGGLVSYGVAMLAAYPLLLRLALRHKAWDPLHDVVSFAAGGALAAGAVWLHLEAIAALAGGAGN
ncbi:oligosaccharide flippase family protein [Roseovarius salis]|uniref:oligosaccharide flippase family protein n=1 Tax=Roseovarius salis TaxID=3376063 RepID=UPI0037CAAEA7